MTKLGKRLIKAAQEANAIARGEADPSTHRNHLPAKRRSTARGESKIGPLEEILLNALEQGSVTVRDIARRLEGPLRIKLNKLRVRGVVIREGKGGAYRQFTYRLVQKRDVAETALARKGGGLAHELPVKRTSVTAKRVKAATMQSRTRSG